MIDEEWLKGLDFLGVGGIHIKGLAGLGSEKVVFRAEHPDGTDVVLKTYRHHLGYHIREIPLLLSETPRYDIDRLNNKLLSLVGNEVIDAMTCDYDRMFSSVVRILHTMAEKGVSPENTHLMLPLLGANLIPDCPEALSFLFSTPMMRRRIDEIATLSPAEPSNIAAWLPTVNGPNFPISDMVDRLREWARNLSKSQQASVQTAPMEPNSLSNNPLFIWGAAVTDGFFTDDELPKAKAFIEAQFGRLPSHPRVAVLMEQASAIASLLACVLNESKVERFTT